MAGSQRPDRNDSIGTRGLETPREAAGRTWAEGAREGLQFFQAFLRRPGTVGAIAPSSRALASAMVDGLDLGAADTVVELGPGTGSFTGPILSAIGPKTTFIAFELDAAVCRSLERRFPGVRVYAESAEHLIDRLRDHGKAHASRIVSGLPWASFPAALQGRLMDAILAGLAPGGMFVTFAYVHAARLPTARRFRRRLESCFESVETSRVVWWNLPPAFVYRCRRGSG
jgi:phosphatidylethanolamine/phosphatidyl-N-methylethanolamine N-methyltransferase